MKRNKTIVGGLRFSCYVCAGVCFSRAFNVCFSRQGRAETCAHNRGRENVSDQFPSRPLLLFFPVPIDNHEPVQPAAKCGTSTRDGLIERLAAFPYFISRQGSRSRIFIADRVERVERVSASLARSASSRRHLPTRTFHASFFPFRTHINVGIVVVRSRDRHTVVSSNVSVARDD